MPKPRPYRSSSVPQFLLITLHSLILLSLLTGCARALTRESQCLESLTADVVQAHEEIATLETAWHDSMARRDEAFHAATLSLAARQPSTRGITPVSQGLKLWEPAAIDHPRVEEARLAARRAHDQLVTARTRYQPLMTMYDKVYQRVRTRTEEETILSDVRTIMLAGPASFIFYPLIRWNVHSVIWDGVDPDAASDPVTDFCGNRRDLLLRSPDPTDEAPPNREPPPSAEQPLSHPPRLSAVGIGGTAP